MPWSIQQRDGKYCVVKQGESSPVPGGCHGSRTDAIKHQRALYANESRMAAMYAELDEQAEELIQPAGVSPPPAPTPSELVKIEIGKENEVLTASLLSQMERMNERQAVTDQALIAALHQIGTRESVVNVAAPAVSVEPTPVNVEAPNVTVEPTPVTVTVEPAAISVNPEIHVPQTQRTVTFERDPLTREVTSAEIAET